MQYQYCIFLFIYILLILGIWIVVKNIPDWVLVQRVKGTKITGEYLGKITKEGIVPPKQKQLIAAFKQGTVREYRASSYLRAIAADIEESQKRHYPQKYKELLVGSAFAAMDLSEIFTYSEGVNAAMLGIRI